MLSLGFLAVWKELKHQRVDLAYWIQFSAYAIEKAQTPHYPWIAVFWWIPVTTTRSQGFSGCSKPY